MNKNNKLLLLLLIAIVLGAGSFFAYNSYKSHKPNAADFMNKIREENKAGIDSLQKALNYENDVNYRIKLSIQNNDFNTAYTLMDSLPAFGKRETVLRFQGNILEKKGDYVNALKKYDSVIVIDKYSIAIDDKARVLIKMNQLKEAINAYKIPFKWDNYDNALQIAKIFELMKKKDSALNYYKIYLEHYPNDLSVKQQVRLIEKNK